MKAARPSLRVRAVSKTYGGRRTARNEALGPVDISVDKGEFVCLIGPNGCGKSTLLKTIAGIIEPTSGSVSSATVAYLPQESSLLPWRTLAANLSLPADIKGQDSKEAKTKAKKLLKEFDLHRFADFYPHTLSGGMQQKAALLRTMMQKPGLLLLDEPFSALDAITRSQMQMWLIELWAKARPAVVCVTHDVRETVLLADTIYVLSARPAMVKEKITVSLPRKNRADHMHEKRAADLQKRVNKLLMEEA